MYLIKVDRELQEYEANSLSKSYAEQIERGVLVLGKNDTVELMPGTAIIGLPCIDIEDANDGFFKSLRKEAKKPE